MTDGLERANAKDRREQENAKRSTIQKSDRNSRISPHHQLDIGVEVNPTITPAQLALNLFRHGVAATLPFTLHATAGFDLIPLSAASVATFGFKN